MISISIPPFPDFIEGNYKIMRKGQSHVERKNLGFFDLIAVKKGTLFLAEGEKQYEVKENEMFICILKDKRIIIASKEEIEFRKIFNNAVLLKSLDDDTVEFNEDLQNLITMDSYEIVEHNGWYELLPLEE